jgi:hypothetical protein
MGFIRTQAGLGELGFVRGPAMIYAAPLTQAPPSAITDVIKGVSTSPTSEVQSLAITGTPSGGTFKLAFKGAVTGTIAYNAAAADVQAALAPLTTIGFGNVACTGGALPGSAVVITFSGALAGQGQPLITVSTPALTGGTTPAAAVTRTTPGVGPYDPQGAWFALGATKNGITPSVNNTETEFTVDQYLAPIGTLPDQWTWSLATSLVETTLENLALVWDMGPVTLDTVPTIPEKVMGFGDPDSYAQRQIAVIHRRTNPGTLNGLLRMHYFRLCSRTAAESSMVYQASGDQQSVALNMRAYSDPRITDPYQRVGYMRDQVPS